MQLLRPHRAAPPTSGSVAPCALSLQRRVRAVLGARGAGADGPRDEVAARAALEVQTKLRLVEAPSEAAHKSQQQQPRPARVLSRLLEGAAAAAVRRPTATSQATNEKRRSSHAPIKP